MTTNNLTTDVFEPLAAAVAVIEQHAAPVDAVSRAGPGPLSARFFGSISERLQAELQALTMLRERWESHLHSAEAEAASRAKEAQELHQSLQSAEANARSKAEAAEAEKLNLIETTAALRSSEHRLNSVVEEKHATLYTSLQSQVEEARQGRLAVTEELEEKRKQINDLQKQLEDTRFQHQLELVRVKGEFETTQAQTESRWRQDVDAYKADLARDSEGLLRDHISDQVAQLKPLADSLEAGRGAANSFSADVTTQVQRLSDVVAANGEQLSKELKTLEDDCGKMARVTQSAFLAAGNAFDHMELSTRLRSRVHNWHMDLQRRGVQLDLREEALRAEAGTGEIFLSCLGSRVEDLGDRVNQALDHLGGRVDEALEQADDDRQNVMRAGQAVIDVVAREKKADDELCQLAKQSSFGGNPGLLKRAAHFMDELAHKLLARSSGATELNDSRTGASGTPLPFPVPSRSAGEEELSLAQEVPDQGDHALSVMEDVELPTAAATLPTESHGSPSPLPPVPASLAAPTVVVDHYDEIIGWFNTPGKWDQRKLDNFKSAFRQKFADLSRDQLVTKVDFMVTGAPANGYGRRVCFFPPTGTKKRTNLPKGKELDRAQCPIHASAHRDNLCVQVQFVDGLDKHSAHPQAGSHRWVVKDRT